MKIDCVSRENAIAPAAMKLSFKFIVLSGFLLFTAVSLESQAQSASCHDRLHVIHPEWREIDLQYVCSARHTRNPDASIKFTDCLVSASRVSGDGEAIIDGCFYADQTLPTPGQGSLSYFGYYGSDMDNVGTGNYMNEIKNHANVAWIRGVDIASKVRQAQSLGMKSVIEMSDRFYTENMDLKPNYAAEWATLANQLLPYASSIVAFYPLDEPYLYSYRGNVSYSSMKSQLEQFGALIKRSFPNSALALTFTTNELSSYASMNGLIPKNYDWFGFDCYGAWDNCRGHSIPWYLQKVKASLGPNQRTFLIGDANIAVYGGGAPSADEQAALLSRAQNYVQLAESDPSVVAMFPFIWQSFDERGSHFWGARELPRVKAFYEQAGRTLRGLSPTP